MAKRVINIVQQEADKKELKIYLHVQKRNSLTVRSDRCRIEQVLLNLLCRSILTSPLKGTIKVNFAVEPYSRGPVNDTASFNSAYQSVFSVEFMKFRHRLVCTVKDNSIGVEEDFNQFDAHTIVQATERNPYMR